MGFPAMCHAVVVPKPLVLFLQFLNRIRILTTVLLSYVGLSGPSEPLLAGWDYGTEPALTSDPITPSLIKARLPAIAFETLLEKRPLEAWECLFEAPECVVCLEAIEGEDEVRELGGCRHVFHRECIDKWVGLGQVTCPLCRSHLLPPAAGKGESRWTWFLRGFLTKLL